MPGTGCISASQGLILQSLVVYGSQALSLLPCHSQPSSICILRPGLLTSMSFLSFKQHTEIEEHKCKRFSSTKNSHREVWGIEDLLQCAACYPTSYCLGFRAVQPFRGSTRGSHPPPCHVLGMGRCAFQEYSSQHAYHHSHHFTAAREQPHLLPDMN